MKKLFLAIPILLIIIGMVSAASISRSMDATASSPSFTVRYQTDSSRIIAGIQDTITGPCTPNSKNVLLTVDTGDQKYVDSTFTFTSQGTCTFNGVYSYSEGSSVQTTGSLLSQSITYSGSQATTTLYTCPITSYTQCTTCEKTQQVAQAAREGKCDLSLSVSCTSYLNSNYPLEFARISGTTCAGATTTSSSTTTTLPDVTEKKCIPYIQELKDGTCGFSMTFWIGLAIAAGFLLLKK